MAGEEARAARQSNLRDFKRQAILEAARKVCDRDGPENLTIRAVAAEAGYTPGAVYQYFSGKSELALELVAAELGLLGKRMKNAASTGGPSRDALLATVNTALAAFDDNAPHVALAGVLLDATADDVPAELDRILTGRTIAILESLGSGLRAVTGQGGDEANAETVTLAALVLGLRLLDRAGRLQPLGFAAEDLVERHIDRLAANL